MPSMSAVAEHKSRKRRRCTWCWQFIEPGEHYKRYRTYDGDDSGTVTMHPECFDAMRQAARDDGGWIQWTPGQERPAREARG